jgi:hypothetical protein
MGPARSNRSIPHPAVSGLVDTDFAVINFTVLAPVLADFGAPVVTGNRKGFAEAVAENTTEAAPISSVASIDKRQ